MVDIEVVQKRLRELDELLIILKESNQLEDAVFLTNKKERLAVLYALQLSIQHMLDIGSHILADLGKINIDEYRQIFLKLGTEAVLSPDLSTKLVPLAGMRNILVHDYVEIDLKLIREFLKHHLIDFNDFINQTKKYLSL